MIACGENVPFKQSHLLRTSILKLKGRAMVISRVAHGLSRPFRLQRPFNGSICPMCRGLATAAEAVSPTLPLAGIRVLDMTRVLAGVCRSLSRVKVHMRANICPAVLYTNTRRPRVGIITSSMMHFPRNWISVTETSQLTRRCVTRAEVIKIEHPTRGDDTRAWGPPYAKHIRGEKQDGPGESAYFLSVHFTTENVRYK